MASQYVKGLHTAKIWVKLMDLMWELLSINQLIISSCRRFDSKGFLFFLNVWIRPKHEGEKVY